MNLLGGNFSTSRICDEKCSKPKIFLALLSKLLCFSFIRYILARVETIIYETRVLAGIAIFLQFFSVHNQH
jgi:hypothetical protein